MLDIKTIELKLERFICNMMLDADIVDDLFLKSSEVKVLYQPHLRTWLFSLQRYFYGRDETITMRHSFPLNWWEQLKQEKFPKWFTRKYPVKYKVLTKEITVREVFPDFEPEAERKYIRFYRGHFNEINEYTPINKST